MAVPNSEVGKDIRAEEDDEGKRGAVFPLNVLFPVTLSSFCG